MICRGNAVPRGWGVGDDYALAKPGNEPAWPSEVSELRCTKFFFHACKCTARRQRVARMQRSEIRGNAMDRPAPDCASLHPGYGRHCEPTGRANARPMTGSATCPP